MKTDRTALLYPAAHRSAAYGCVLQRRLCSTMTGLLDSMDLCVQLAPAIQPTTP